jgi:hypothetical protein
LTFANPLHAAFVTDSGFDPAYCRKVVTVILAGPASYFAFTYAA